MVNCPTIARARVHSQQARVPGCVMSSIWMAVEEFAKSVAQCSPQIMQ